MLLELLPARRLYIATNAVFALGSIFMATQIARIYWPESKAQAVVLSMPVLGDWLVIHGGNSSLINAHYNFKEQRNALDIERLVNGHERTGDIHKLESYPSWGETLYAPADGTVAVVENGLDDNMVGEMDRENPVGNHVCIDMGNGRYVLMAHLQKGSVLVSPGDKVYVGQPLAKCGNSGNTSHPHLHIQVQDAPRIFVTGQPAVRTFPILFCGATRVRAEQTANGAPFFVRRNDEIISAADKGSSEAIGASPVVQPPVVVETFPVSGSREVEPGETEIRVRFSKDMADGSWSWTTAWEKSAPETLGMPHYLADGRTCAVKARLEPGTTYAWWLNSESFKNFKDKAGISALPYLLIFQTKPN
jgi:hypothetical protein